MELRKISEINQRELADRLDQSRSFVSRVEIFERRIDFVQLVEWLRALGVNEKKFLTEMLDDIPSVRRRRK